MVLIYSYRLHNSYRTARGFWKYCQIGVQGDQVPRSPEKKDTYLVARKPEIIFQSPDCFFFFFLIRQNFLILCVFLIFMLMLTQGFPLHHSWSWCHSCLDHTGYPDSTNAVGDNQRRYKKTKQKKKQGDKKDCKYPFFLRWFGRQWAVLIFFNLYRKKGDCIFVSFC